MATIGVGAAESSTGRIRWSSTRLAGAGGLVFLALITFQNIMRAITGPALGASPDVVIRFLRDDGWTIHVLAVTYIVGFVPLLAFASGLAHEASRVEPRARGWAAIGVLGTMAIAVFFALITVLQTALLASVDALAGNAALTQTVWALHDGIFTINLLAVATAMLGLGVAARMARLVPGWMGVLSCVGAALMTAGALPMVAEVEGSHLLAVSLAGYLCWLLLLLVAGTRLLRE